MLYNRAISIDDQQRAAEFYVVMVVAVLHMMECIYASYVAVTESMYWNDAAADTAFQDSLHKITGALDESYAGAMSAARVEECFYGSQVKMMYDQDLQKAIYDSKQIVTRGLDQQSAEDLFNTHFMLPLYEQESKRRVSEKLQLCITIGLSRLQVENDWFFYEHCLAAQAGIPYESYQGLTNDQVKYGIHEGLTREQVIGLNKGQLDFVKQHCLPRASIIAAATTQGQMMTALGFFRIEQNRIEQKTSLAMVQYPKLCTNSGMFHSPDGNLKPAVASILANIATFL